MAGNMRLLRLNMYVRKPEATHPDTKKIIMVPVMEGVVFF